MQTVFSFKNGLHKYLTKIKITSYSLLGSSRWSPVTNKSLQEGPFNNIFCFSSIEMQLLGQSCSFLTKQTLPKKIPGCFAPAPTTHQTWPDIREEVLQPTGRASLIPHPTVRRHSTFCLCAEVLPEVKTQHLNCFPQMTPKQGVKKTKKFLITELKTQTI